MKAIVIKQNERVLFVAKIDEITTKQFLDLQREVKDTWESKDLEVKNLQSQILLLNKTCVQLINRINDLQHQINVITGIEEEEPTGTCYTEDGKLEEVYFDPNETQPEPVEESVEEHEQWNMLKK